MSEMPLFEAIYGLAVVLETLDRDEEAFRAYSRVLELYPAHERAQEGADRLRRIATGTDL